MANFWREKKTAQTMKLHFSRAKRPFPLLHDIFLRCFHRSFVHSLLVTSPSYYCDSPYRINDHINVYIIPYCHHSFDNHLSHIQRKLMETQKKQQSGNSEHKTGNANTLSGCARAANAYFSRIECGSMAHEHQ